MVSRNFSNFVCWSLEPSPEYDLIIDEKLVRHLSVCPFVFLHTANALKEYRKDERQAKLVSEEYKMT